MNNDNGIISRMKEAHKKFMSKLNDLEDREDKIINMYRETKKQEEINKIKKELE